MICTGIELLAGRGTARGMTERSAFLRAMMVPCIFSRSRKARPIPKSNIRIDFCATFRCT
jgi:hypothetical protein